MPLWVKCGDGASRVVGFHVNFSTLIAHYALLIAHYALRIAH